LLLNNGTSMKFLRQSRTTTGRLTHSISNLTEDHQTSDVLLPTLDGGNSLDMKVPKLSTRKERHLMSLEARIERIKTFKCTTDITD